MLDRLRVAHADDPQSVSSMADSLRAWEPRLDLSVDRDNPMIFEPDGTLYGVALGDLTTLRARHKDYLLRRGDAIVVPRGVAVDAEPGADLVAIRHDGTPPHHFRERFIQNWGFEFRPAPSGQGSDEGEEILPEDDARYRVAYHLSAVGPGRPRLGATGMDLHLLVPLAGEATLHPDGEPTPTVIRPGTLALIAAGIKYRLVGDMQFGRVRLPAEAAYEAMRGRELSRPSPLWSPEFEQSP